MAKEWDRLMKMLAGANPQHFVNWVVNGGAQFEGEMARELTVKAIEADVLFLVTIMNGQKVVLHIEFQKRNDPDMGRRVWEYNFIATFVSGLPVYSFVIYLKKARRITKPYYEHKLPTGEISHRFYYSALKLWEIPGDVFKQPGMEGLLPLLPLAKDGGSREVVEEMIVALQAANKEDLLPIAYAVASLIFRKSEDRKWLRWRFEMLEDIIEESWAYREMVQKGYIKGMEKGFEDGLEKGMEKGLEKGLERGRTEGLQKLRQVLLDLVAKRFPLLAQEAQQSLEQIQDDKVLQRLIVEFYDIQTAEDARHLLAEAAGKKSKKRRK